MEWFESAQSNGLIKWFTVRIGTLPNNLYAAHVTVFMTLDHIYTHCNTSRCIL